MTSVMVDWLSTPWKNVLTLKSPSFGFQPVYRTEVGKRNLAFDPNYYLHEECVAQTPYKLRGQRSAQDE